MKKIFFPLMVILLFTAFYLIKIKSKDTQNLSVAETSKMPPPPPPKLEPTEDVLFAEIEKSNFPEIMKKQIKEDLRKVDVDLSVLPFNEGGRNPSGQETGEMALLIDLVDEMETEMNKGEFVDWSEEDKKIMDELNQ